MDHFMDSTFIGRRITLFRERRDMSQEALARELGLNHRQTLQAMESGRRNITAKELLALMDLSGLPMGFFTDPFSWEGEGRVSFRATTREETRLAAFEAKAGRWAMLWRWLSEVTGAPSRLRPILTVSRATSYEEVAAIAERLVFWFRLGSTPARGLRDAIERELGIPVCYVTMPRDISGATFHDALWHLIFINREESPERCHFDLAHELFHALTWESLPPERLSLDSSDNTKPHRREQLADIFASSLLMPEKEIRKRWKALLREKDSSRIRGAQKTKGNSQDRSRMIAVLREIASSFEVSVPACAWRLVNLGILDKDIATSRALSSPHEEARPRAALPPPYSPLLFEQLAKAIKGGRITVRKAAQVFDWEIDELRQAFNEHHIQVPFDL